MPALSQGLPALTDFTTKIAAMTKCRDEWRANKAAKLADLATLSAGTQSFNMSKC